MDIGEIDVVAIEKGIILLLLLGEDFNIVEFMDYPNGKSLQTTFEYNI